MNEKGQGWVMRFVEIEIFLSTFEIFHRNSKNRIEKFFVYVTF